MKPIVNLFSSVCLAATASLVSAGPKPNVDRSGLGIQGYDPVAFFTDGRPVLGKDKFHATYRGVTYRCSVDPTVARGGNCCSELPTRT